MKAHFKQLLQLHKREEREKCGLFLIEGEREVSLASDIEVLYYTDETPFVERMRETAETIAIPHHLFAKISYRDKGVIALAKMRKKNFQDLPKPASLLLLAESIEKPGNLGAMLRTCDAVGASGMLLAESVCDLHNPNVIRASLGAFFRIPVVACTRKEALEYLEGMQIVVATPNATLDYFSADFTRPTCIVIGSEKDGVHSEWLSKTKVKIPMLGDVDSLNASVAASLIMYEALRQRSYVQSSISR